MLREKQFCKVPLLADLPALGNVNTLYLVVDGYEFYERDGNSYNLIISPGMITAAIAAHVLAYH